MPTPDDSRNELLASNRELVAALRDLIIAERDKQTRDQARDIMAGEHTAMSASDQSTLTDAALGQAKQFWAEQKSSRADSTQTQSSLRDMMSKQGSGDAGIGNLMGSLVNDGRQMASMGRQVARDLMGPGALTRNAGLDMSFSQMGAELLEGGFNQRMQGAQAFAGAQEEAPAFAVEGAVRKRAQLAAGVAEARALLPTNLSGGEHMTDFQFAQEKARGIRAARGAEEQFVAGERGLEQRIEQFFAPFTRGGTAPTQEMIDKIAPFLLRQETAARTLHQNAETTATALWNAAQGQQGKH